MSTDTLAHSSIRILPPQLANQIAAGEVVERPASVVKELVENSIDAGASSIHIDIEQGGHKRIYIRDDGGGIAKEELALALSRHATSKIYALDDLDAIVSMGFRGEALASISSVSRCSLTSKPKKQEAAWQAKAEGRDMDVDITPAAHPNGTSVDVVDLFYNTPARRRFLRAAKTEFQHIEQVVKRIALAHSNISFELRHNNKKILKYPAVALGKRIEQVCKSSFIHDMAELHYTYEELCISGWVSKVGVGFDNNEQQYLFINNRMMKDRLLMHAIRQAYEGMLPDAKYPGFVIFLSIPPEELDVNVHPAKHEVRFRHGRKVHDAIFKAISELILSNTQSSTASNTHDYFISEEENDERYIGTEQDKSSTAAVSNRKYSEDLTSSLESQTIQAREYIRPIQASSPHGHGLSGGITRRSGASSSYNRDTQAAITEAGQNYQSLMTSNLQGGLEQAGRNCAVNMPECMLFNDHLLVKLDVQVFERKDKTANSDTSTKLYAIPTHHIVTAFLQHKLTECGDIIQQPLLMPVSVKYLDLHNGKLESSTQVCPSDIDEAIKSFARYGFTLTSTTNKVTLKQVPALFRQLPWAKLFPPLMSNVLVSVFSKQQHIGESQYFLKAFASQYTQYIQTDTEGLVQLAIESDFDLQSVATEVGHELHLASMLLGDGN